jgi:HK97 gp10 family phage protein
MAGIDVTVEVEGDEAMIAAIEALADHVPAEVKDLMEQLAKEGHDYMNGLTPVRTGYLKSRNQVEAAGLEFTLSNDADYAAAVNYGTRHMPARPFFEPTIEYLSGEMETVLATAFET